MIEPAASGGSESDSPSAAAADTQPADALVAVRTASGWMLGTPLTPYAPGQPWEIRYHDGSTRAYTRWPANLKKVVPGTLLHAIAAEPDALRARFEESPAEVLVDLLRETRGPLSKQEIEAKLDDLRLARDKKWWSKAAKLLKEHPHVTSHGGKYQFSETVVG